MKHLTFDTVREIGLKLPRTEAATAWGSPALTVDGQRFAAMAIHKSAEPNSLVLHVDVAERDELIEAQPDIYYIADHYVNYSCVLVRLARVHRDTLEDLLRIASVRNDADTAATLRHDSHPQARPGLASRLTHFVRDQGPTRTLINEIRPRMFQDNLCELRGLRG